MQWLESEKKKRYKFILIDSCYYWMVSFICYTLVSKLLLR